MPGPTKGARLKHLIQRKDKVLAVLHPPTATHARIMEQAVARYRAAVDMKGKLPRYLGLDEHLALGVNIAWYPGYTHQVMWAALWDFMQDFQKRGTSAWEDFVAGRRDRPYPVPEVGPEGEGPAKQRELEERYFSEAMLKKYKK